MADKKKKRNIQAAVKLIYFKSLPLLMKFKSYIHEYVKNELELKKNVK